MAAGAVVGMVMLVAGLGSCVTSSILRSDSEPIDLPELTLGGRAPLDEALAAPRSVRSFLSTPLELDALGRTAPSAEGHWAQFGEQQPPVVWGGYADGQF